MKRNDTREAAPRKMSRGNEIDPLSLGIEATYENQVLIQQPLYVGHLPVVQNQQMLYQLEMVDDSHDIIYVVLPENVSGVAVVPEQKAAENCVPVPVVNKKLESATRKDSTKPNSTARGGKNNQMVHCAPQTTETDSSSNTFTDKKSDDTSNEENKSWRSHAYRCDYKLCSKTFSSMYEKKAHTESHYFQESSEFKCNLCNMVFDKAVARNKHIETHSVPSNFKCKHCSKLFPYYTSLIKHKEAKECIKTKLCTCQHCGAKFVNSKDLSNHLDTNLKICKCSSMICGDHAYQIHLNLCASKNNSSKTRNHSIKDGSVVVSE